MNRPLLLLFLIPTLLHANPQERDAALEQARQFLLLSPAAQKDFSQKLSAAEAEALKSQIIALRKQRNPDIVALDYVLTQLATLSALDVAQTRLNSLLWVIALTFTLLSGFLFFLYMDQRKLARSLLRLQPSSPPPPIAAPSPRKPGKKKAR